MQSLTERYRPKMLADIVGQDSAIATLCGFLKHPCSQAFLFHGPTGTGKTSAAIALARELGCNVDWDVVTVDSGDQKADKIRELADTLPRRMVFGSGWRVVIVNESDIISKQAEAVWLDVLESLPPRTLIIFSTNAALRSISDRFVDRCLTIEFPGGHNGHGAAASNLLIRRIWESERPGEAIPTANDLDAMRGLSAVSYRRVVQIVATRLLDPSPFVPTIRCSPVAETVVVRKIAQVPAPTLADEFEAHMARVSQIRAKHEAALSA